MRQSRKSATPHFRVNVYAFANSLFLSKILLTAAGAESISEGDYTISPIIVTDVQLYNRIAGKPTIQRAVTSAFRNWQDKCMFTVDDCITALQQRYLATKATDVSEMMACKCEKLMLLAECEMLQKKCKRLERLWMEGDMKNSPLRDEFSEIFSYIENMTVRVRGIPIIE